MELYSGLGAQVADFSESWLRQTKGRWAGKPLIFEPWQREEIDEMLLQRADGSWVYREGLLGVPRKNGKALALDTPIPTPEGWTELGNLRVGDKVFGVAGVPRRVTGVTLPQLGRPCCRVVFGDGTSMVADVEHEWLTDDREQGYAIRTTAEIAQTLDAPNGKRHRIDVASALELPEVELPVDPYTLGAWLGDGHTANGRLTCYDGEVWAAIPYVTGPLTAGTVGTRTVFGLMVALRDMGVLGNKHIPPAYLRASRRQRLALLRGLMDTDGTVSKRGLCEFDTTNPRLMADVRELIRSLGWKVSTISARATLYGADCGEKWTLQFTAYADEPVFTIPRKFERQKPRPAHRTRSQVRCIVACEPVQSVPVRCIEVEGGYFLAGEEMVATHNSTIGSALGLWALVATAEHAPEVYAVAASKDQAKIVFGQAKAMAENSPRLKDWVNIKRDVIECPHNGGIFRVLSSDAPLQHGLNPYFVIIDELWAHKDPELYYAMTTGDIARENSLVLAITTAGFDRTSICFKQYQRGQRLMAEGGIDACRRASFYFKWFEPDQRMSAGNPDAWAQANPSSWVTEDVIRRKYLSVPESVFRRLHMNQWTETEEAWIKAWMWDECEGIPLIEPDLPTWMSVDVGVTRDSSGITFGQWHDEILHTGQVLLVPKYEGETFSVADTRGRVAQEAMRFENLREINYDPAQFRESRDLLAERGFPMVEFNQGPGRMGPASETLYELVKDKRLIHDGDLEMKQQVLSGVIAPTDRGGWRISKRKSQHRIDGLVSLAMTADRAVTMKNSGQRLLPAEAIRIEML